MAQLNSYRIGPDPGYLVVVVSAPFGAAVRALRAANLPARAADMSAVVFDLRLTDGVSAEVRDVLAELSVQIGPGRVALAGAANVVHDALPSTFPVVRVATLDGAIERLATVQLATPLVPRVEKFDMTTSDATVEGIVRVLLCEDDSVARDRPRHLHAAGPDAGNSST